MEFFSFGELDVKSEFLDKSIIEIVIEQMFEPKLILEEDFYFEKTIKKILMSKYVGKKPFRYGHIPSIFDVD